MLVDMKLPLALTALESFEAELFSNILSADDADLPSTLVGATDVIRSRKAPIDIGHWLPVLAKIDPFLIARSKHQSTLTQSEPCSPECCSDDDLISILRFLEALFSVAYNKRYFLSVDVLGDILMSASTIQLATIAGTPSY